MTVPAQPWRPRSRIRTVAIGIIRREGSILAVGVPDDRGDIKGWRPPGGGIEFGERAADALVRELREECGSEVTPPRLLGVCESLYKHEGAQGHEIVFVFETALLDATLASRDVIKFKEDDGTVCAAHWLDLADVRAGRAVLYPAGLLALCG